MAAQVPGFDHWHINADEPAFYDYNMESKTAAQLLINAGTPFRSSDHDPLLIEVNLSPQPTTYAMWQASRTWAPGAGTVTTDDPDLDGLANLIEFALNTHPELSDATQLPQATRVGNEWHLDYRSRVQLDGTVITPEWSEDLSQWFTITNVTTLGSIDLRTEMKRATLSTTGKDRLFTRLRVTGP